MGTWEKGPIGDVKMNEISNFDKNIEAFLEMEKEWRKTYRHRKPCKEWKEHEKLYGYGFCKHYAKARKKHFSEVIEDIIEDTLEPKRWNGKVNTWIYISNK